MDNRDLATAAQVVQFIPATKGLFDGVVLVIVNFSFIVLTELLQSNGLDIFIVAIALVSTVLALSRRVSANLILVTAALAGYVPG
jgi:chromate transporter